MIVPSTEVYRAGQSIALSEGLHALAIPYPVDGRVSWHAPWVRGYASMNCYVMIEDDQALLIDTGLGVHLDLIIRQIARGIPRAPRGFGAG